MTIQSKERLFVDSANPHSWLLVADDLHDQAVEAWNRFGDAINEMRDDSNTLLSRWDGANRSVFLLAGFALENALKAFLVYENPSWISNGRLCKTLKTHNLVELSGLSSRAPTSALYTRVLERFEAGLESWARYPCALSADQTEPQSILKTAHWREYTKTMKAYGGRLCEMMQSNVWKGPHGYSGRWTFEGEFLGAVVKPAAAASS